jgi:hypothetical protein
LRPGLAGPRSALVLRRAGRFLLGLWAVLVFLLVGSLAIAHWAALPQPELKNPALVRALAAYRLPEERGFLALHVLYTACRCSERVLAHLEKRGRGPGNLAEGVVLVGAERGYTQRLARRGFRVSVLQDRELYARFGLTTAPLLLVAAPDHSLRYVGGYTERKQGPVMVDQRVIQEAMHGASVAAVPVFGCAVTRQLQRLLDPFGLKYSSVEGGT